MSQPLFHNQNTLSLWQRLHDDLLFVNRHYRRKLALLDHEAAIRLVYRHLRKRELPLDNPTTLPEVIQWLKLYSDTSQWSTLADKFAVRQYVTQCGLQAHLNEFYALYDKPQAIEWERLPQSFVLKMTNGCHSVIPVKDKNTINHKRVTRQLEKWAAHPFGLESAEFHYTNIPPRIIAEKYLQQDGETGYNSLIDYKIYCIGGKANAILSCHNRKAGHSVKVLYDLQWRVIPEYNTRVITQTETLPKPKSLDQIIAAAEKLSAPFPFVRIDYYEIEGRPVFGEMTFTPAGGYCPYGSERFLKDMGQFILNNMAQ